MDSRNVARLQVSGAAKNNACSGLRPTKAAPCPAARRITVRRSAKSPMPQLLRERNV